MVRCYPKGDKTAKMKFRDDDEVVIDIIRIEKVKKEYEYKAIALIVILLAGGIAMTMVTEEPDSVVRTLYTVSSGLDSVLDNIGVGMALIGLIFMVFCIVRPTWLKIGEVEYEKTSLSTERDYKEFKDLK